MFSTSRYGVLPRFPGSVALAVAAFSAGILVAQAFPAPSRRDAIAPALAAAPIRTAYQADVIRILDGDTFEARVHVWPGMDITTKVRLRGIDAPELKARCAAEQDSAQTARDALEKLLTQGTVGISDIGQDKYGGRVLAKASTRGTTDISTALLDARLVRTYGGGKRDSWCR